MLLDDRFEKPQIARRAFRMEKTGQPAVSLSHHRWPPSNTGRRLGPKPRCGLPSQRTIHLLEPSLRRLRCLGPRRLRLGAIPASRRNFLTGLSIQIDPFALPKFLGKNGYVKIPVKSVSRDLEPFPVRLLIRWLDGRPRLPWPSALIPSVSDCSSNPWPAGRIHLFFLSCLS